MFLTGPTRTLMLVSTFLTMCGGEGVRNVVTSDMFYTIYSICAEDSGRHHRLDQSPSTWQKCTLRYEVSGSRLRTKKKWIQVLSKTCSSQCRRAWGEWDSGGYEGCGLNTTRTGERPQEKRLSSLGANDGDRKAAGLLLC